MSVMKRVRDITAATIHEMLEKSENPLKVIEMYMMKQKEQMRQNEQLLYQTKTHAESLRVQYIQALALAEKRGEQAEWAVKAGEEHAARLALQEKLQQEEKYERYKRLYEETYSTVLELEQQLQEQREEYQEICDKREYYLARIRSAQLQKRLNEMSGSYGMDSGWFRRLEEKVTDLEVESKAWNDLRSAERYTHGNPHMNTMYRSRIEEELQSLKIKIQGRSEEK
ncbi:PspA/IM30 family protein [Marinicrinis lubricantis]|uniref:PspA/IM30 family protein n=1 Tax=Marinicrinis lubricantis TaxID=2086470 RepID=A0ABW1IJ86_9BACL